MKFDEKKKIVEEEAKDLLDKMGFEATVYVGSTVSPSESEEEAPINVDIQSDESKFLIGKYGVNLASFQHLLRVIVNKKAQDQINLNVDVNGYKEDQKQNIINLARDLAAKATQEGKPIVLNPMNSYERRLVHVELADFKGVKTESIGEGEDRKVIIKPVSLSEELDL